MRQRILIAEDDELQGEVLRAALSSRGYDTEIVTDGLEAVRRICTQHYDLALLDYQLPEVDGLAAAQLLHDLVQEQDRPRLIAITALAPRLNEQQRLRGPSFDAIVSKQLGLPALLSVIDTNLAKAAETNKADMIFRSQQNIQAEFVRRRGRWMAVIAALPALVMAGVFVTAFALELSTLHHALGAYGSAQQTMLLNENAGSLINSVQDVEVSQKVYLATRTPAALETFEANVQHVDQMLVSSSPLSADATPGFGADLRAPSIIAPRLRVLAEEANQLRDAGPAPALSEIAGLTVTQQLSVWAATVLATPQQALIAGLAAIFHNIELVLVVLGAGVVYGLGSASVIMWRRWQKAGQTMILAAAGISRLPRSSMYQGARTLVHATGEAPSDMMA